MADLFPILKAFDRLGNFPMDATFVFDTKAALDTYAGSSPKAYAGQICSAVDTGLLYILKAKASPATGFNAEQVGSSGSVAGHEHSVTEVYSQHPTSGVRTYLNTLLDGKQPAGNYAELDGPGGKVNASQLPSFVDDIIEYDSADSTKQRPSSGESGKIYVDISNGKVYRWGGSASGYVEISASPGSTDDVIEGTTPTSNKYYTKARVLADAPVLSVAGHTGAVTLYMTDVVDLTTTLGGKALKTIYSNTMPTFTDDSGNPTDPSEGQRWVDTTDYHAYEYVNGSWIEILSA